MDRQVILKVNDLHVSFSGAHGEVKAVRGVSYELHEGEVLGIVGESGSGKSASAYSIMGLLRGTGRVTGGSIEYRGTNILENSRTQWEALRGKRIGMIFQNPMACLDPMMTVGKQLREAARCHSDISKAEADEMAKQLLLKVGIGEPDRVMKQYASGLSGGMCQRVMIAMALIQKPEILIADEPTTALDVTVQAQIIRLIDDIRRENNMAVLFITHDMGIVAEICDTVCVMYAGKIVEKGSVYDMFDSSRHPYTAGLMRAIPNIEMDTQGPMISIEGVPVNMSGLPAGCAFHPRCSKCMDICREKEPPVIPMHNGGMISCWLADKEVKVNE